MDAFAIIGYAALAVSSALVIIANRQNAKSKIKDDNIKDLVARVEILEKEREYAREQHLENQKAIAHLEGQLKTYKDIPLQQIADSIKALATTQDAVLKRMNESAKISKHEAETGGMLVKNKGAEPLEIVNVGS